MGTDTQNAGVNFDDLVIEQEEQGLSNPSSDNMQFLQSTLTANQFDSPDANLSYSSVSAKPSTANPGNFGNTPSGLSPAHAVTGLLGAVAVTDLAGATSAAGMAAQVATAAPVSFGKTSVGDSAALSSLGDLAMSKTEPLSLPDNFPFTKSATESATGSLLNSSEMNSLSASFAGVPDLTNPDLMTLIAGLGPNSSPEDLQAAIAVISDQIELLNSTFDPVFEGLSEEIQDQILSQDGLSSTDLGVSIFEDAGSVSSTLTDLLGSIDVLNNPQLTSLLNLDSTFDTISSLIGSLPNLDLRPITGPISDIVGGITDPVTDIIGGITDPIIDPITDIVGGITDPIIDPITDIVGGITDPVTDIIGGITDPVTDIVGGITDPVTDIVGGITDPVTDIVGGITDPVTDIVGGITDPVTDIVGGITDPITDPVTDIVGGITDPIIDPITDIVGGITDPIIDPVTDIVDGLLPDLGLLSGLGNFAGADNSDDLLGLSNSGISSNAGSEGGGPLGGLLGALDPNR